MMSHLQNGKTITLYAALWMPKFRFLNWLKQGDLCPHQDLVYFSDLTEEEQKSLMILKQDEMSFSNT